MASDTISINRLIEMFNDIANRHMMINAFSYGPLSDINTEGELKMPYLHIENTSSTLSRGTGIDYREVYYNFDVYVMDRINKGDSNYQDTTSDTLYILHTIISEIDQHPYYVAAGLKLIDDVTTESVFEATDENVNGHRATLRFKQGFRFTPCTVPIDEIPGWTFSLNGSISTSPVSGGTGPQGPQGPQGFQGATGTQGTNGTIGINGATGPQGFQGFQGVTGSQGFQGPQGPVGATGQDGSGSPGNNDVGVMYLKNNTIPTIITTINERKVVSGTMSTGILFNFIKDPSTNSLKYTGPGARFHIIANFSFSGGSRDIYGFYIGKNTNPSSSLDPNADRISESEVYVNSNQANDQPAAGSIQTVLDLNTDDRVFFIVQNRETTADITVEFMKFVVTSITAEKGPTGSQGVTGPQGQNGTIGINGATGPQGFQGATGAAGTDLVITNRQTSSSYVLTLTDVNKLVEMATSSTNNIVVPTNASASFTIGSQILLSQYGTGSTFVTFSSPVSVNSAGGRLKLSSQYSGGALVKINTNEWYLFGDLLK
jgi:hypothetical protein